MFDQSSGNRNTCLKKFDSNGVILIRPAKVPTCHFYLFLFTENAKIPGELKMRKVNLFLGISSVLLAVNLVNSSESSDLSDNKFFWLKRDTIGYPFRQRKKIGRKQLKQLINLRRRKALRRQQQHLIKNRVIGKDFFTFKGQFN